MKTKWLVALLGIALLGSGFIARKSGENRTPSEPVIQAAGSENKMMIVAKLSIKKEKITDFIKVARGMIEMSNKESGCTSYQLYQDPYDNSKFVFVEAYKNQAAVDTHFSTDYFKAFGPKIGDMVTAPPEIKIVTIASEILK